ncbi:hypothetical protein HRbin16_02026 [bacterium HR16]|nr:hypothetical protein HRbin16_02026 [bacterium HR16]
MRVGQQHRYSTLLRDTAHVFLCQRKELLLPLPRTTPGVLVQNGHFHHIAVPAKWRMGDVVHPFLRDNAATVRQVLITRTADKRTALIADAQLSQSFKHGPGHGSAGRAEDGWLHAEPFAENGKPLLNARTQVRQSIARHQFLSPTFKLFDERWRYICSGPVRRTELKAIFMGKTVQLQVMPSVAYFAQGIYPFLAHRLSTRLWHHEQRHPRPT